MKGLSLLLATCALTACTGKLPNPEDLVDHPSRYHDRQIRTCGQIIAGGGQCSLMTSRRKIWISSADPHCVAPIALTTHAEVSGQFSSYDSGANLVIRKARLTLLDGSCLSSDA